jgi:hypothetical protein
VRSSIASVAPGMHNPHLKGDSVAPRGTTVYAKMSNTPGGEPSKPGEVEVSLRHVVVLVVALSFAVWVAAVAAADHYLITIIALAFLGFLAVAAVKVLIGFRARARQEPAARRQYLTALVLTVVLPIAVLVWALAS